MSHSDVQKGICYKKGINSFNFLCIGSHKRLRKRFAICVEMTEKVCPVELCVF